MTSKIFLNCAPHFWISSSGSSRIAITLALSIPSIGGNTPERFRAALQATRDRLGRRPADRRILTINCWNEWTEGSYLEPDTVHALKYLEAVRDVLGGRTGLSSPQRR